MARKVSKRLPPIDYLRHSIHGSGGNRAGGVEPKKNEFRQSKQIMS
jgi:hypothetical protein